MPTSNAVGLTLGAAPAVQTQPASQSICVGSPVTFTVSTTARAALGVSVAEEHREHRQRTTSSGYSIAAVAAGDAGSYRCVVTNACGNANSNAATLTVNTAPAINTQPSDQTACVGESATFSVRTASGVHPLSYQWHKGGSPIGGADADTYTIAAIVAGDAGSYDVVVSNACGSVPSAAATLTVPPCGAVRAMSNCDGVVDFFDIDPFLMALFTLSVYEATFPGCPDSER